MTTILAPSGPTTPEPDSPVRDVPVVPAKQAVPADAASGLLAAVLVDAASPVPDEPTIAETPLPAANAAVAAPARAEASPDRAPGGTAVAVAPPVANPLRVPPIIADLLPLEINDSRRTRKIRRIVVSALAALVVVVVAWYALATYQMLMAQRNLTDAETSVQRLTRQQKTFSQLVTTQAASKAIGAQLTALLAQDLQWSVLLASLRNAAPSGIQVTGVNGAMLAPENIAAGTGSSSDSTAAKPIGALVVTGKGVSKAAVAAYVDSLAKVSGLGNPLLGDATEVDHSVQFTVRVDITKDAIGGRYTKKSSPETRGK
jgi:Tfp pilus assembly protein PilN